MIIGDWTSPVVAVTFVRAAQTDIAALTPKPDGVLWQSAMHLAHKIMATVVSRWRYCFIGIPMAGTQAKRSDLSSHRVARRARSG